MNDTYTTLSMRELMQRAELRGYTCQIEHRFGFCAVIKSGFSVAIIGADVGLNNSASYRISQDKYFTENLLQAADVNCILSVLIDEDNAPPNNPKLPCIIKPNKGSGGAGVSRVEELDQLKPAIDLARQYCPQVLIQDVVEAKEFRIVMLDGECLFAYERTPWTIQGDGLKSIHDFIVLKNESANLRKSIQEDDPRLQLRLKQKGLTLDSVLKCGQLYQLMSNANLSSGGSWEQVQNIDPEYIKVSALACNAIGLRYAGIDVFCNSLEHFENQYRVIEVNSNPGFQWLRGNEALLKTTFDKIAEKLFDKL